MGKGTPREDTKPKHLKAPGIQVLEQLLRRLAGGPGPVLPPVSEFLGPVLLSRGMAQRSGAGSLSEVVGGG